MKRFIFSQTDGDFSVTNPDMILSGLAISIEADQLRLENRYNKDGVGFLVYNAVDIQHLDREGHFDGKATPMAEAVLSLSEVKHLALEDGKYVFRTFETVRPEKAEARGVIEFILPDGTSKEVIVGFDDDDVDVEYREGGFDYDLLVVDNATIKAAEPEPAGS